MSGSTDLSQAVVFSEGELFLDDCDFSGSTSSVLVYSEASSTAIIRNTALGDNNCKPQRVDRIERHDRGFCSCPLVCGVCNVPWVLLTYWLPPMSVAVLNLDTEQRRVRAAEGGRVNDDPSTSALLSSLDISH